MTCIVGLVDKGVVYMGGDSAGVVGLDLQIREDVKVFKKGDMVFGFTSSFRMGQLIQYKLNIPHHITEMDDFEYLCSCFVDALISCFKDNGYARVDNNKVQGGVFLVGYRGKLYSIQSDFQVGMVKQDYDACGCGESYALGALKGIECTKEWDEISPEDKIKIALGTAETFSAGVRSPFNIVSV